MPEKNADYGTENLQERVRVRTRNGQPCLEIDGEFGLRLRTMFPIEMDGQYVELEEDHYEVKTEFTGGGTMWIVETPEHMPDVNIEPEVFDL